MLITKLKLILFPNRPSKGTYVIRPRTMRKPKRTRLLSNNTRIPRRNMGMRHQRPRHRCDRRCHRRKDPLPRSRLQRTSTKKPRRSNNRRRKPLPTLLIIRRIRKARFLRQFNIRNSENHGKLQRERTSPFLIVMPCSFSTNGKGLTRVTRGIMRWGRL